MNEYKVMMVNTDFIFDILAFQVVQMYRLANCHVYVMNDVTCVLNVIYGCLNVNDQFEMKVYNSCLLLKLTSPKHRS